MLEKLRKGATTKIAAIVIFIPLIIAFAIWGVADVFRGYGQGALATVGGTEISRDQFQQAYQDELNQISAQFGRRLTPEQARLFGLESRVLSRLVGRAALDLQIKDLGLGLSDKAVAEAIQTDPAFAGADGKFSKVMFDQLLRQTGYTERGFVVARRNDDLREQITDSVLAAVSVPQAMIEQLHRHREERRTIEFLTVDPAKVVKVGEPEEAKLKDYFEANKRTFATPELRKFALLLLTRDGLKSKIPVSEEDLKAAYEAERARYETPERRRVLQVAFPDKAAAEKARAALAGAKNFVEEAGKLGFKESDVDLGVLSKRDFIDPKIAEAAFALAKDQVSQPVEGRFTTVILRITDITPGKVRAFDEVKAEVRDRIASDRAARDIQALHDKVDDERGSGQTLKAVADKLGLEFREVAASDRSGKDASGKPAFEHPEAVRILGAVFGGVRSTDTDAVELSDGGYAWFDVLQVMPEQERPLDEVRAKVREAWAEAEKGRLLQEAVAKLVERAGAGTEPFAVLVKEAGGKVETTEPVTRQSSPTGLTSQGVTQAFALPLNGVASVPTADGASRTLLRVTSIKPADAPTKEQIERLRAEVQRSMQGDALSAYVAGLQTRYGVRINEQAVRQTLGLDRQP
ncbi:MAG: SurA N-terminal domain-containing protein [Hyphomicrobiales bacterium]|nr:SurA N-terminal domain-containing protein [Hyphomicrobiales bacterium]